MSFLGGVVHSSMVLAALFCSGCSGRPPADADIDADVDADAPSPIDGGDGDSSSDADVDIEPDADREARPGPMTLVLTEIAFSAEPLCDHDGDGRLDNALTALGPSGPIAAAAIAGVSNGTITEGYRLLSHFPWIDDLSGPSDPDAVLILNEGLDLDGDHSDDFDGEEPFHAAATDLDSCGEPVGAVEVARVEGGIFEARGEVLPLFGALGTGRDFRITGVIEPDGRSAELTLCTYAAVRELGEESAPTDLGGLTMLELILAGGVAFGIPGLPGVQPDLDLDDDGLERLLLDDAGHVETCVDGDLTTIAGRDCFRDPRMADGLSLVMDMSLVGASFAGREPGWEDLVDGVCDDPPEESLWDPR